VVAGDDQGELREALQRFVDPIAPTVRIQLDGESPAAIDLTGEGPTVAWQHLGHGLAEHPLFVSSRSARFELPVAEAWAPLTSSIDATPLRGKKVRFDARVRVDGGEGGKAQLWLRVDVGTRGQGFFDNMEDRPIRSSEWATYSIQGDVSHEATQVVFGGIARGNATVWFDDFSLTVLDGKDAGPITIPNPGFELGNTEGWRTQSREYAYDVVEDQGTSALRMQRKSVLFESMPESGEILDLPLAAGLRVRLPVALPDSLAKGSTPNQVYAVPSGDDPAVRAAAVIVTWNVMRHFHPYLDEIDQDWDAVLDAAIGDLADDRNSDDLQRTLERMVAKLGDGLAEVEGPVVHSVVPVEFARIEGKVIVTAVREGSPVEVGDELVAIDGVAIETISTEAATRVGGSPGQIDVRLLRQAGVTRGPEGEQVELKLKRDDDLRSQPPAAEFVTIKLAREAERGAFPVARPAIEVYEDGVIYVDLVRAPWTEIGPRLAEIAAAPGVVFDVRGRPNYNLDILHHLRATSAEGMEWDFVPEIIYPNQQRIGWDGHASRWDPAQPRITGKVVFVIDARASYSGETLLGFVEGDPAMQFVGAPTAGANGDANTVEVPGGFEITFAGTKVKRLDGRPHHLVGIVPTIPVEPTLAGFMAGRDELLEVALATARGSE
jgi:C-terminal processing protease CtpA/Prc